MKRIIFLLLFAIGISNALHAQVKIGNNPQNIDQASVLELESTDKVLVITRVTTAQMNAIVPLQGALVYNTDVQGVHYFDGAQWINIGSGGGGPGGPLTANPIVNDVSTIVITPTGAGNNLEVAPNSITTDQIQDGGINGVDIQDGSIGPGKIQDFSVTQTKLSENSVGAFALDNDNIGLQDFSNAVTQFITSADIVSGDAGNVLESRPDGAFYDDTMLMNDIQNNTDLINNHIAADLDISPGNEIQNLQLVGNQLTISGANTVTLPAGSAADGSETIINNSATITVTGNGTSATPYILTAIGGGGGGTTEVVDGTTLTGLGTPVDPFKIEPGANGQFLTTGPTGVAWTTVAPGGAGTTEVADQITITGDGQIATPFTVANGGIGNTQLATDAVTTVKILDANVTNTKIAPGAADQILRTASDGLTVNWVDLPTGSASITDATLTGDGTSPATALGLADDAVTTAKIVDANVTNTKIAPGAADQILRTASDGLTVNWVDLPTGSAALTDATLTGDGTSPATALGIADNAVTTAKINNATILLEDIAPNGATTNGEIIQWNSDINGDGTGGGWEVAPNAGHTGDPKSLFFAGADGLPRQFFHPDNGGPSLYWDYEGRTIGLDSYGALAIGVDNGILSNDVKVHIAEQLVAAGATSYGLMLQNRTQTIGNGVGMVFSVDDWTKSYGKGALVFERTGTWAVGDFHFLQNNATGPGTDVNPTLTDKAFTIKSNKDIVFYGGIDINGTGLGTAGQVLSSTGTGLQWVNNGGGGGLTLSNDPANSITLNTAGDGGIIYSDAALTAATAANATALLLKEDSINKSDDVALGISPILYPTQNAVKTYVDTQIASVSGAGNLATNDLTQLNENRTYNMATNTLSFTNGKIGIGTGIIDTNPEVALHVLGNGQIRAGSFAGPANGGSALNPTFRFNSTSKNDGMYQPDEDEIAFSAGGEKIMGLEYDGTDRTAIFSSIVELDEELLDINNSAGTPGQVLSSTGTGTAWVDPTGGLIQKGKGTTGPGGEATVNIPNQPTFNYVINLTVRGVTSSTPYIIQVLDQQTNNFTLKVFELNSTAPGGFLEVPGATYHYTVFQE